MGIRVLGVGAALPRRRLTNLEIQSRVETSDEWIRSRTGIQERPVLSRGEHLVDLMEIASRKALARAELTPEAIEAIVVGTVSAEYTFPSSACELQARLGLDRIPAFDLAAACSGFVFALSTAVAHVRAGDFSTVLLVGADALTTMLDWNDRRTCVLFGDGAGAVVLARREHEPSDVLATVTRSSGALRELLYVGVGNRSGFDAEVPAPADACIRMKGPELFRVAVRYMEEAAREVIERAGVSVADVKLVVPHQANLRIIEAVGARLGIDPGRVFVNVHSTGNTSAASVPIALEQALDEGRLERGDLLLLVACGGGLTWGASLLRW